MTNAKKYDPTLMLCLCALFVALTAVCSWISIPIEPVPICLSLLAVHLCGALLPGHYAALSMLAYLLLGLVGAPVFANMRSGAAVLFGNTGGYLVGYILCAFLDSVLISKWGRSWWKQALVMVLGVLVCYAFGTVWFMVLSGRTFAESLALCVIPFLPGDAVKIALAVALSLSLYPALKKMLPGKDGRKKAAGV